VRRKVEYILVPKAWFSDPVDHAMKTVVRPPTARTRSKQLKLKFRVPKVIFLDIMRPLESGSIKGFEWTDEDKTDLKPTDDKKTFYEFKYEVVRADQLDTIS